MLADDFKITIKVLEDCGASTGSLHDYKWTGAVVNDYGTPEIWVRGTKNSGQHITLEDYGSNPENADFALCLKASSGGDNSTAYTAYYTLSGINSGNTLTVDIFSEGTMPGGTTQRIKRKRADIERC